MDIGPGLCRRIAGRLDHMQMDTVREEGATTHQHNDLGGLRTGMTVGLAEAMALLSAHRTVVEVEGEKPDILPLPVDDLSVSAVVVGVSELDGSLGHTVTRAPST